MGCTIWFSLRTTSGWLGCRLPRGLPDMLNDVHLWPSLSLQGHCPSHSHWCLQCLSAKASSVDCIPCLIASSHCSMLIWSSSAAKTTHFSRFLGEKSVLVLFSLASFLLVGAIRSFQHLFMLLWICCKQCLDSQVGLALIVAQGIDTDCISFWLIFHCCCSSQRQLSVLLCRWTLMVVKKCQSFFCSTTGMTNQQQLQLSVQWRRKEKKTEMCASAFCKQTDVNSSFLPKKN